MRLPDFLIIGAMKSGTTSLFFDLAACPSIYLPDDKEPNSLTSDHVLTEEGRAGYARLFRGALDSQICFEASTSYSKLPDVPGVPARARQLLGPDLKIVYLVREPVARTLSHHYHELAAGAVEPDVDRAVRRCSRLIDYSLYARQIQPWLETFGESRVRIVLFESYVADRPAAVAELAEFLGVESQTDSIEAARVFNASDRKRSPQGTAWRFSRGAFYRRWIRPWLSRSARSRLRRLAMPKAPPRPAPPTMETVDYILDRVRPDVAALQGILGSDEPPWDLAAVRRSFLGGSGPGGGGGPRADAAPAPTRRAPAAT